MSAISLVEFSPAENKAERKRFIELQWAMNKDDPAWVAPLRLTVEDNLDTKKNPFYKHARIVCWNAYRGSQHVGRIAAVVDERHNQHHNEKMGFWGFFECTNDNEVARALFHKAEGWVKGQGMTAIRGPVNPSLNHEAGLVINSFERQPYVMMTHNPPYYVDLVEKLGHKKEKDLYAFDMTPADFDPRVKRIAERVKARGKLEVRPINMKKFHEEVALFQGIYNAAWEENWGFVPMDDAEFKHLAKQLKDIIWPEFCQVGFVNGKAIGFALSLPDINQVLKDIPSGRLLPFGIFKLLRGLKPKAKKIRRVRVITLGVIPEWRASGLASVFYYEAFRAADSMGLHEPSEMSWILEDNKDMISAIEAFAGKPAYKTFRIYQKAL
ncbi:MAG: N-acetyltransferase [Proteobacteria bacterium]|nr:MAG: N-acetyltransferase [Pseudomonadota bacterium]